MTCKKHPKYLAKLKPRVLCESCWAKWFITNGCPKEGS